MENSHQILFFFFFFLIHLLLVSCTPQKVYVVYLGEHKGDKTKDEIEEIHETYLSKVKSTRREARSSLIYSYKHAIDGFSALLSSSEAQRLSEMEEVKSVFESHPSKYSLTTTRSWEFSGVAAWYL
ncbi:hypothetical protein M569_05904 [Genlisea aurea]|uniref:Inhibitor I9 domain-containing protein n=1 Tax=Genlisea aurea TaxID=192259 RepID=S8CP13_9LAMI|nr:hypothetical protein M569_05904 [Genlisea aurea]